MPETVNCNLCGGADTTLLYQLRDYRFRVDDILWNIVRCTACGLGFLNPRPTASEIERYYPSSYFRSRGRQADQRYLKQARFLPRTPGRLLDIGTAQGDFLAVMRNRGWEVQGIESSEEAENPHGITIHRIRFPADIPLDSERFDVITAWAVFEHLHDPAGAFSEARRLLRPGGLLIIQIPNLRSIYGRYSRQEDVPRHLYFFDAKTLGRYGSQHGLRLVRIHHTTDLFGGSGRGILRLALVRGIGRSTDDFFDVWRATRRERFHRWPLLTLGWVAASILERAFLTDWLVCRLRMSGQIVAVFER